MPNIPTLLKPSPVITRVDFASNLRGLAAVIVLLSHYCGVFWLNRAAVELLINAPILSVTIYPTPTILVFLHTLLFFDWGSYGVGIFFLISGFVIPFSLSRETAKTFLIRRFMRIFPLYSIGLTITLISVYVSGLYFSRLFPYIFTDLFVHYIIGFRDLFLSKNIDGIIWTLEIEFKFYILCVLFIKLFKAKSAYVFIIPLVLFFISCITIYFSIFLCCSNSFTQYMYLFYLSSQYLIFMFIGVVYNYFYCNVIIKIRGFLLIGIFLILFYIHGYISVYKLSIDYMWGYFLSFVTFALCYRFHGRIRSFCFLSFLSDISYPLYVIHGVSGYVFISILLDYGVSIVYSLLIVTICVFVISWLLHKGVEIPAQAIGRHLSQISR